MSKAIPARSLQSFTPPTTAGFERVAALIHDDVDWVIYAPMSVFPFAGPRRARRRARGDGRRRQGLCVGKLQAANHDRRRARAALLSDVGYRQRSTNRVLRLRIANFLRFEDGRLIEYREFIDSYDAVEQALGRELQL